MAINKMRKKNGKKIIMKKNVGIVQEKKLKK